MNKTREKCAWQILVKYYIILTHLNLKNNEKNTIFGGFGGHIMR